MSQFKPATHNKFCISTRYSLLKIILISFCFFTKLYSQSFHLKRDSEFIKNYQIEVYGKINQLFISENSLVEIPLQSIAVSDSLLVLDLDRNISYNLYKEELIVQNTVLFFTSGQTIETIIINNKKKELSIGIEDKGSSSKLYMLPNVTKIVEIHEDQSYLNKKIKKIRYYFSSGKHPASGEKIDKESTKIIPIMYTCDSVDCKNPQRLLPDIEVNFGENNKYLEIDVSHRNIIIDENFKNIYVGFISLGSFVMKMKKTDKIGENKCYNVGEDFSWFRQATYQCPIIFILIE